MVTTITQGRRKKINLRIAGMTCATCVISNEQALKELPGVENATVNLATGTAAVEYDPARVNLKAMIKAVSDIGYGVAEDVSGQQALDREREARQHDVRYQLINLIIAGTLGTLVMIGMLQPYWFFPKFVPM